jgi:hypothetical protein
MFIDLKIVVLTFLCGVKGSLHSAEKIFLKRIRAINISPLCGEAPAEVVD